MFLKKNEPSLIFVFKSVSQPAHNTLAATRQPTGSASLWYDYTTKLYRKGNELLIAAAEVQNS